MPESKSSPRRILAKERQRQALELRKAGVTLERIAETVGFKSKQAVHDSIRRALADIPRLPAQELRELDLQRLDQLGFAVWQRAIGGDTDAIHAALRILAQRAKLLGLEIPIPTIAQLQVEQQIHVTVDYREALNNTVATLAARAGQNGGAVSPNGKTG